MAVDIPMKLEGMKSISKYNMMYVLPWFVEHLHWRQKVNSIHYILFYFLRHNIITSIFLLVSPSHPSFLFSSLFSSLSLFNSIFLLVSPYNFFLFFTDGFEDTRRVQHWKRFRLSLAITRELWTSNRTGSIGEYVTSLTLHFHIFFYFEKN